MPGPHCRSQWGQGSAASGCVRQMRMVPSSDPEAQERPSGAKRTQCTGPWWPLWQAAGRRAAQGQAPQGDEGSGLLFRVLGLQLRFLGLPYEA